MFISALFDSGCDSSEFQCSNGRCIKAYYECDNGLVNCDDDSDEQNCGMYIIVSLVINWF